MCLGGLGETFDGLGLSVFLEYQSLGKVNEQIAGENNEESLTDGSPDTDLEYNRHKVGNKEEQIGEMKDSQARTTFSFVFDLTIAGRKPFGEDQDEEVDRQSEMVHWAQNLEVVLNDRDHMVEAERCESYLHVGFALGKRIGLGREIIRGLDTSKEIPSDRSREKNILSFSEVWLVSVFRDHR